jgi:hypothetical protein
VILGELGDSGYNPRFDGRTKIAVLLTIQERFRRRKIVAPDLDSGLIVGDLLDQKFPSPTLASRDALRYTPPLSFEKISCLALIMGESRDSGQGPGLDRMARRREI